MENRRLGKTEVEVSVIALGCWSFAGGMVWGEQDDAVSIATVRAALDAGVNFFDTAEGYGKGHSEAVLSKGLGDRRHEAVIATKVGSAVPEEIEQACEQSLRHLGRDYIDLYLIHWPRRNVPLAETVGAFQKLKAQGKIRAFGVCNFAVEDLTDLLALEQFEIDQLPYSLLWRAIEHEIQPLCGKMGVGLICYSPLMQGLLTDRYASADEVPDGLARTRLYSSTRPMADHDEPGYEAEVFAALEKIRRIAEGLGQPMAAVALAWVRQQAGVTSMVVGARSPEELRMNLPGADLMLSEQTVRELEEATEEIKALVGTNADMWSSKSRMR